MKEHEPESGPGILRAAAERLPGPHGLPVPERLVLWAVRIWMVGRLMAMNPAPVIAKGFRQVGAEGEDALLQMMRLVDQGSIRPLSIGCPCCSDLTADEGTLLSAISTASADREWAEGLLGRFVRDPGEAVAAGRRLSVDLRATGFALTPLRHGAIGSLSLSLH